MNGFIRIPRVRCGIKALEDYLNLIAEYLEQVLNREIVFGQNVLGWQDARTTVFDCAPAADASPVVANAEDHPWQPYGSPWLGEGDDPNADDRKKRFRLLRGKIGGRTPTNIMDEFVAFGDVTDADIEEDDAVYTQIYARVPVSETDLGTGDIILDRAELDVVEGFDLADALGGDGPTGGPDFGDDGSLPAYLIVPIGEVSWWGGSLHFLPGQAAWLDIGFTVTSTTIDCEHATRRFFVITLNNTYGS